MRLSTDKILTTMMEKYKNDFEQWCRDCVVITDKESGEEIPFVLNAPQRRVLAELEAMRKGGKPIRLIMLKARQWGGSTLIQTYMAWIQLVRRRGWSSVICGHVKDASANIQGLYSRLLRDYPKELKTGNPKDWQFAPYEKSRNISYIASRDCRVAVATALSPDSVRGGNYAMAHLSEVAFWGDGDWSAAQKIVRSIAGSIVRKPDTLIVMESTANGENNYFYYEWQRAVAGESDKVPIFVPWHEIEIYARHVDESERESLLEQFDEYEHNLLDEGVSIEHVAWYHDKRKEYITHSQMMAEYPSTPQEAFLTTTRKLFTKEEIESIGVIETDVGDMAPHQMNHNRIIVVYPTDKVNILVEAYEKEGEIHFLTDKMLSPMPLRGIVSVVQERILRQGFIGIMHNPADESPHSAWICSTVERLGLPLYTDDNDNNIIELTKQTTSEIIDCYIEAVQTKKLVESSPLLVKNLASLNYPPTTLLYHSNELINTELRFSMPKVKAYERFAGSVLLAHAMAVYLLMQNIDDKRLDINDFIDY